MEAREKACPLFVPLVEEGWIEHAVTEQVARIYLGEAFSDGFESADVLVLGCTHYPLIKWLLRRLAPPHVTVVDSAESTAHVVRDLLGHDVKRSVKGNSASMQFFATDSVEKFQRLGARFLDRPIRNVQHIDLKE
jgi:glutamate racemase